MSELIPSVQVGQTVPDFKLTTFDPATGGFGEFDLAAQRKAGKWTVLFFYPADFTFVCATEFAALGEVYPHICKLGAELVTVSTDTQFTHLAWQREEMELSAVKYPMGADRTGAVSRLFGVYDANGGNALRGTFIISPAGQLMASEVNFYNSGRNVEELCRKLEANVFLAKNPSDACPAKWKHSGDVTLKPSAAMVGRVHQAVNAPAAPAKPKKSK